MFAVMDFLTVPTTTFGVLYRFFTIGHDQPRRLAGSAKSPDTIIS
jgi:hypothetical protein